MSTDVPPAVLAAVCSIPKSDPRRPAIMLHDCHDDVSEKRRVNPAEQEVLDLLDPGHQHAGWLRLSLTDWARVDRVADALAAARAGAGALIPAPRASAETTSEVPA